MADSQEKHEELNGEGQANVGNISEEVGEVETVGGNVENTEDKTEENVESEELKSEPKLKEEGSITEQTGDQVESEGQGERSRPVPTPRTSIGSRSNSRSESRPNSQMEQGQEDVAQNDSENPAGNTEQNGNTEEINDNESDEDAEPEPAPYVDPELFKGRDRTVQIKDIKDITPIQDPNERATRYLAKYNIIGLFQNITADIAYRYREFVVTLLQPTSVMGVIAIDREAREIMYLGASVCPSVCLHSHG